MIKVTVWKELAFVAAFALSASAWAVPVEVGSEDTLVADANLGDANTNPDGFPSGDANEIDWMNALLGTSYTAADYVKWDAGTEVSVTQEGNYYYFSFGSYRPDYFFVKYGVGGQPSPTNPSHYLYVNNGSTAWGYVSALPGGFSHVGFFDTGTTVPEPTSLALLGLGLAGLGFARRRRSK